MDITYHPHSLYKNKNLVGNLIEADGIMYLTQAKWKFLTVLNLRIITGIKNTTKSEKRDANTYVKAAGNNLPPSISVKITSFRSYKDRG